MVRVISVHHFLKQHIETVEEPTATTIAPPDRLLLALSSHCIEVRDLKSDGDVLFSFPSVDEVRQIVHCLNGDYIATLERKYSRQNDETMYARIYANWDSVGTLQQSKMSQSGVSLGVSECGMVQPMRARIAGRVTPTTNQSEICSLEMIELPIQRRPDLINCCQISGNILILSAKYLILYKFCVRTHHISKLQFLDFEELPLLFELTFVPSHIQFADNYIACMNQTCLQLFTITTIQTQNNHPDDERINHHITHNNDESPLSYNKSLLALQEQQQDDNILYNFIVNLPSIFKENSAIHKHCPFTCCDTTEMIVNFKSSSIENWNQNYEIKQLLQLKLKPMVIEGAHRQISEEFKCLLLKPLYIPTTKPKRIEKCLFKSNFGYALNSVACLFSTQQEAYLYVFTDHSTKDSSHHHVDNCVAVYPFTAPVYHIVLEDYLLHALTETGLESYTLRIGHQLTRNVHKVNNIHIACPSVQESVCLVGLRPFIGVQKLLISDNYLILLANSDGSPTHSVSSTNSNSSNWTLYNLQLPTALNVFNDFLSFAQIHQFSSPQTYCHLISEAHMLLKVTLMLIKWRNCSDSSLHLIEASKIDDSDDITTAYLNSCALLADYYIMCSDPVNYKLSLPYYKMSQISPLEVLKRVQKLQQLSTTSNNMAGLLFYLKTVLLQIKTWTEADVLFTLLGEQNFVDIILDLFSKYDQSNLSTLVLKNNVLREYATDKLINIFLENQLKEYNDLVALAVLCLQRYKQNEARIILELIATEELHEILIANWELLFDTSTTKTNQDLDSSFSELTAILIVSRPKMLAQVLAYLITDLRAVSLEKLLKIFLEFLPSHMEGGTATGSLVLQILLEKYFKNYFSLPENVYKKTNYDLSTFEALNILIRTYLSQIQFQWQINETACRDYSAVDEEISEFLKDLMTEFQPKSDLSYSDDEDYLFSKIRWPYLDQMPPFDDTHHGPELILKKLQALLCSQLIPKQIINEMLCFFQMNADFIGNISLQSIVLPVKEGTHFLIDKYPQCLLQYGKDRFTKDEDWNHLLMKLQTKNSMNQDDLDCRYYAVLQKDILMHLATTIPLQRFLQLLPSDCVNGNDFPLLSHYESYILICKQTAHANHIKRLIVATGQKLLTTLNL